MVVPVIVLLVTAPGQEHAIVARRVYAAQCSRVCTGVRMQWTAAGCGRKGGAFTNTSIVQGVDVPTGAEHRCCGVRPATAAPQWNELVAHARGKVLCAYVRGG